MRYKFVKKKIKLFSLCRLSCDFSHFFFEISYCLIDPIKIHHIAYLMKILILIINAFNFISKHTFSFISAKICYLTVSSLYIIFMNYPPTKVGWVSCFTEGGIPGVLDSSSPRSKTLSVYFTIHPNGISFRY